jgi:cbb3-type cytochrome oxidase subunit 3
MFLTCGSIFLVVFVIWLVLVVYSFYGKLAVEVYEVEDNDHR